MTPRNTSLIQHDSMNSMFLIPGLPFVDLLKSQQSDLGKRVVRPIHNMEDKISSGKSQGSQDKKRRGRSKKAALPSICSVVGHWQHSLSALGSSEHCNQMTYFIADVLNSRIRGSTWGRPLRSETWNATRTLPRTRFRKMRFGNMKARKTCGHAVHGGDEK